MLPGLRNPLPGGGVYRDRLAWDAATVAIARRESDLFTDEALAEYERRWREDIGRELDLGFRLFQSAPENIGHGNGCPHPGTE